VGGRRREPLVDEQDWREDQLEVRRIELRARADEGGGLGDVRRQRAAPQ
jgi:hypothetical protein